MIVFGLRPCLVEIVSLYHGSFILNGQALDNIIEIQDIFHLMKINKGNSGLMTLKIDLKKA